MGPGWVLPYLGMVGRFPGDNPRFGDFQSDCVPILYLNTIRLTPSFCRKKIGLFLSHLVPEILEPKFGLLDFKHFVSIFILIFNPIDPQYAAGGTPFLIDFRSF